jgi:hypothetical protein
VTPGARAAARRHQDAAWLEQALDVVRDAGGGGALPFSDFTAVLGLPAIRRLEARFAPH